MFKALVRTQNMPANAGSRSYTQKRERERERLQCFSQAIEEETKSQFQEIKTIHEKFENLHVILLCKKQPQSGSVWGNKAAYCSLSG